MKRPLTQPRLPDVLVGTAILALLAAVLAPTIANARQARSPSITAGLHFVRTAALLYTQDYDGTTHPGILLVDRRTAPRSLAGAWRTLQTSPYPDTCKLEGDGFVNAPGGCFDSETGITWSQRQGYGTYWNWYTAQEGCQDLVLGGYDDWRLPTKAEFLSVVAKGGFDHLQVPSITMDYWTSTLRPNRKYAWAVDFSGYTWAAWMPTSYMAYLCVRP